MVRKAKIIAAACCSTAAGASAVLLPSQRSRLPRFDAVQPQRIGRQRHRSLLLSVNEPVPLRAESSEASAAALELDQAELLETNARLESRVQELEDLLGRTEGLCEVLDDMGGDDFAEALKARVSWLLGLLVMQSCSSFVLAENDALLASHPTVIYFMTMLVGAGGNAGNQSAVRMIRGLATGEVNPVSARSFVNLEARMALCIALVLVAAGFVRVLVFKVAVIDAIAISASLFVIVASSVVLGATLPLMLNAVKCAACPRRAPPCACFPNGPSRACPRLPTTLTCSLSLPSCPCAGWMQHTPPPPSR